jgi:tripartite-type tricarboxylate transporter receptor subunit TctC
MQDPAVVTLLTDQQVTPMPSGPQEFEQLIKSDLERWTGVIKAAGIRPE